MSKKINLVFPHQLFQTSSIIENDYPIYLVEEYLYFNQYKFHKQKLAFHRATMKAYADFLQKEGQEVIYIESIDRLSDVRILIPSLLKDDVREIHYLDTTDYWLERRIQKFGYACKIIQYDSPLFINSKTDNQSFFRKDKKSFFQTTFYKQQRKRCDVLLDSAGQPVGGKWTYDVDNRKKYPKGKQPPAIHFPQASNYWKTAVEYVNQHYSSNPGSLDDYRWYPVNHLEAEQWLQQFLVYRFHEFGAYEDAIVRDQTILHHSLLSPLINVGLLSPQAVVDEAISYAETNEVPINSTEGFVRQVIGWREFIRGMYEVRGSYSRTKNYWNFNRRIPDSFYTGTTGILPVDDVIQKVLKTGYCHHIERLMILGNFMLLCEFHPDEVYRWFMELFIDAYDWVMVPNVYGMSQFADGGTFATKPYISGSNYIKKMSDYPKGGWTEIWDGLFWNFIDRQQSFFKSNPRLSMMVHTWNKMSPEKKQGHLEKAHAFLTDLDQ